MDYRHQAANMQDNRHRQMEEEMNRFEAEISGGGGYAPPNHPQERVGGYNQHQANISRGPQPAGGGGGGGFQRFIPHQLQRNLPNQRPHAAGQFTGHSDHVQSHHMSSGGGHMAHHQQQQQQATHHHMQQGHHHSAQPQFVNTQEAIVQTSNSTPNTVGYTVTPMGLPPTASQSSAVVAGESSKKAKGPDGQASGKKKKNKKNVRTAGGQVWEDSTLGEWEANDFRLFCGDLGNDVTEDVLNRAFSKYPSYLKCKIVRDKKTNKTKGYGFISFKDPQDFIRAMRDMNGKYVGSRPIKLRKSTWRDRAVEVVKKKKKERAKLGLL